MSLYAGNFRFFAGRVDEFGDDAGFRRNEFAFSAFFVRVKSAEGQRFGVNDLKVFLVVAFYTRPIAAFVGCNVAFYAAD